MEKEIKNHLQSVSHSDYQIVDGEQNIFGWKVKNEADVSIGVVKDLLFELETNAIRYVVVDLSQGMMNLNDKKVAIPIGIAQLHEELPEVIIPNIHGDQFVALPAYDTDKMDEETERQIRMVIGSPAALRIEETIAELDDEQFYKHNHFDTAKFYGNRKSYDIASRNTQEQTIQQMIENSKQNNFNAAEGQIGLNAHHNEGKHIDIKNQQSDI
jgi:hypothetical protein